MPQCVSIEDTVVEFDFGAPNPIIKGTEVMDIGAPIVNKGRHGNGSLMSTKRSEFSGRKLAARRGIRIELCCRVMDMRRTCSVWEYRSGRNHFLFQMRNNKLHVTNVDDNNSFEVKMPKTWVDIELVFGNRYAYVHINGENSGRLAAKYDTAGIGMVIFGETGSDTDLLCKARHGVLIESLRVVEQ